jgi:hypothetical protein
VKQSRTCNTVLKGALILGLIMGLGGVLLGLGFAVQSEEQWDGNLWSYGVPALVGLFGLLGFIIGSFLGTLLGFTISVGLRFWIRHVVAFVGSLLVLALLLVLSEMLLGDALSTDVPWEPAYGCTCGTALWLLTILFPVSAVAEHVLVRRLRWPWWIHVPTMVVAYFVASAGLVMLSLWLVMPDVFDSEHVNRIGLLAVGLGFSLWGVVYWSILRASDALLNILGEIF